MRSFPHSPMPIERSATGGRPSALRPVTWMTGLLAVVLVVVGLVVTAPSGARAASTTYSIWPTTAPAYSTDPERSSVQLGTRFTTSSDGVISAIRFFKADATSGPNTGRLWSSNGRLLASVDFTTTTGSGWRTAQLTSPVAVTAGSTYVASYTAPRGRYAVGARALSPQKPIANQSLTATQGVYTYSTGMPTSVWRESNYLVDVVFAPDTVPTATSTPSPTSSSTTTSAPAPTTTSTTTSTPAPTTATSTTTTTTQPATSPVGYPDASTTGAKGVTARRAGGTITTPGTVIANTYVDGQLTIRADNVTLRNVHVDSKGSTYAVLTYGKNTVIEDTTLQGTGSTLASLAATAGGQFSASRVNAFGAEDGIRLESGSSLRDSYVHDLLKEAGAHNDAVTADGNTGWEIVHNTIVNDISQTAAVWVGDPRYSPSEGLLQDNYLGGGGYTIYGGTGTGRGIRVINNVFTTKYFPRSGSYGLVAYWDPAGNAWTGNTWADGPNAGKPAGP